MSLKIKKYIFGKSSLFIVMGLVLLSGVYIFFNKSLKTDERMPASYTLHTVEIESRSKKLMETARRLHTIEDYKSANKTLSELLDKYPYTVYTEEASFLLAKGLLHEQDYHQSEQVIQKLQEYAPDSQSKWMGYSLLVLGKIYEERGETDSAIGLYREVITGFSDQAVVDEAEDMLLAISL